MDARFVADSFVKSYGRTRILKSASAWARAGEVTVLLGRNGCGKSTLLRSALGLCPAEQGVVLFNGTPLIRPHLWRMAAQGLFYLPDRGLLSRRTTLRTHIDLIQERFGVSDCEDVLEQLQVTQLLDAFPDEMSGGEVRRAEVALALSRRPACLLADEPLTEIEPRDRALIMGMLQEQARAGAAVLMTGHEVRDLLSIADSVIWMAAGTTHGLGSPQQARAHHQFQQEYLGPQGG